MRVLIISNAAGRRGRWRYGLILSWIVVLVSSMAIGGRVAAERAPDDRSGAVIEDVSLGKIFMAQPIANAVLVLRTGNMSLLDALSVAPAPSALALDGRRQRLYVASDAAGVISVYDARTNHLLQRRTIGGRPGGLALSHQ